MCYKPSTIYKYYFMSRNKLLLNSLTPNGVKMDLTESVIFFPWQWEEVRRCGRGWEEPGYLGHTHPLHSVPDPTVSGVRMLYPSQCCTGQCSGANNHNSL